MSVSSENTAAQWKQINVQEAQQKIQEGSVVAIDVRMPFDYAGGRIPGSVNLPGESLRFRKQVVPEGKELLIFSEDGMKGTGVCTLAISLGYTGVYYVEGGIDAWREAGYDMETISEGVASPQPRPQS